MSLPLCRIATVFSLSILTSTAMAQAMVLAPPPGAYAVGLHIVNQYDVSRGPTPKLSIFDDGKPVAPARPMQTLVWYPGFEVQWNGKPG